MSDQMRQPNGPPIVIGLTGDDLELDAKEWTTELLG